MIIKTSEFKKICTTVLSATDNSEISTLTETLELKAEGNVLALNVTNKEYYVSVTFPLEREELFHAAVNANLFLKLIAAVTSETIELTIDDTCLKVKANGNYKIPLIFENEQLMVLPTIDLTNPTLQMNISSDILESIVNFNSKQLTVGTAAKPVQKMFYVDEQGCLTFTSGACINNFTLEQPMRILFNQRLVNLFKLFKGTLVNFTLSYEQVSETIIQTKVCFETPSIKLSAITGCDDSLLAQVPVDAIRRRANTVYPYSIVLNVTELSEAINRILIFSAGYGSKENLKPYSSFEFKPGYVSIYDAKRENHENITYQNGTTVENDYNMTLDLFELKKVLDSCSDQYVTLNFGNSQAAVLVRNAIRNVIPEVRTHGN